MLYEIKYFNKQNVQNFLVFYKLQQLVDELLDFDY